MSGNTVGGIRVDIVAERAAYDALPAPIRAVYQRAPFDYAVRRRAKRLWRDILAGRPLAAIRRELIEELAADLQEAALKTYGPDHPDAERSRLAGRMAA